MDEEKVLIACFDECVQKIEREMKVGRVLLEIIETEFAASDLEPVSCPSTVPSAIQLASEPNNIEKFQLDMDIKTVSGVWTEYRLGTSGKPAVFDVVDTDRNYPFAKTALERRTAIIRGRLVEALELEMRYGRQPQEVLQIAEENLVKCNGDFKKLLQMYEEKQST